MPLALIIVGIAIVLYGVTIMLVGSGSWFFAFWYVVGFALITIGWTLQAGSWGSIPIVVRRTIEVVGCLFVAFIVITQALIVKEFNDRGEPDLDYIIVLGAQVRSNGPSLALRSRLEAAITYLEENERTCCIVSGGQGPNEPTSEADAMADYLVGRGIDPGRIIVENQSLNTTQNIENSMAFIDGDVDRIGIVTSNYHVFRALAIARKHGIVHVSGIAADATPYYLPNNMTRESIGLAKDFVLGNL